MSDSEDAEKAARFERSRQRGDWSIKHFTYATDPGDDLSSSTTAHERLAMEWHITLDAWSFQNVAIPTYVQNEMPGRVIRRTDGETSSSE